MRTCCWIRFSISTHPQWVHAYLQAIISPTELLITISLFRLSLRLRLLLTLTHLFSNGAATFCRNSSQSFRKGASWHFFCNQKNSNSCYCKNCHPTSLVPAASWLTSVSCCGTINQGVTKIQCTDKWACSLEKLWNFFLIDYQLTGNDTCP